MGNLNKTSKSQKSDPPLSNQLQTVKFQSADWVYLSQYIESAPMTKIGSLSFNKCCIGPKGVKMLTRAQWTHLQNLNLAENRLGNEGIVHLVKIDSKNLKNLNLVGNGLRDQSCRLLLKSNWKNLINLTFNQMYCLEKRVNRVGRQGIKYLRFIPIVKSLDIQQTKQYNRNKINLEESDFDFF